MVLLANAVEYILAIFLDTFKPLGGDRTSQEYSQCLQPSSSLRGHRKQNRHRPTSTRRCERASERETETEKRERQREIPNLPYESFIFQQERNLLEDEKTKETPLHVWYLMDLLTAFTYSFFRTLRYIFVVLA